MLKAIKDMTAIDLTLLSFKVQDDMFAVDAHKVMHILEVPPTITPVPNVPYHMLGVINLHGNIIPVVNMRALMNREGIPSGVDACIVVINPTGDKDSRLGILVDHVQEVIEAKQTELKETILNETRSLIDTFEGTLLKNNQFIHVIDVKHITDAVEK